MSGSCSLHEVDCVIPLLHKTASRLPHPISLPSHPPTKRLTHNMSGTQSPPLEYTGEEKVLGASAANKPAGTANVKTDAEQRGGEWDFSPSAANLHPATTPTRRKRNIGLRTDFVCPCSLLWWHDRRDEAEQWRERHQQGGFCLLARPPRHYLNFHDR